MYLEVSEGTTWVEWREVKRGEENRTGRKNNAPAEEWRDWEKSFLLFKLMVIVIQCNKVNTPKEHLEK